MCETKKIHLKTACIQNVPLQTYGNDFSMIVNGEEFKISRLMSDLLSPNICKIHKIDPTFNLFNITTQKSGDFSRFLRLVNFEELEIPLDEIEFITEIIEILGTESIEITETQNPIKITKDNVFSLIKTHERSPNFFNKQLSEEIDFISTNFFEICEEKYEELRNLSKDTLMRIVNNTNLRLNDEDELLNFVNKLYQEDDEFGFMYESIIFVNTTSKMMKEFVKIFDFNDLNSSTWKSLSTRLQEEIVESKEKGSNAKRYTNYKICVPFSKKEKEEFTGILRHFTKTSPNEITITSSSVYSSYQPQNAILFDDQSKYFMSNDSLDSWICFDFQNNRVTPTDYTIKFPTIWGDNSPEPQNWVIEGSKDNKSWDLLSEEKNCSIIHGCGKIHTFPIRNQTSKEYQYIRLRQTGKNGHNNNYLIIGSFELYGILAIPNQKVLN